MVIEARNKKTVEIEIISFFLDILFLRLIMEINSTPKIVFKNATLVFKTNKTPSKVEDLVP